MALKKTNLSPEVKSRLRQAVLGEITPEQSKSKSAVSKVVSSAATTSKKPPLKTLNKISPTPNLVNNSTSIEKPAKKIPMAEKSNINKTTKSTIVAKTKVKSKALAKVSKKVKAVKAEIKTEEIIPSSKPSIAKSIYKPKSNIQRDWEKIQPNSDSLERLFNPPKTSIVNKKSGFFKRTTPTQASVSNIKKEEKSEIFSNKDAGSKPGKKGIFSILKIVGLLILLAVLLIAFDVFGLYQLGFKDNLSYQVAKNLRLPAGSVNGETVLMTDYLSDLQLLNLPLSQKREGLIDYSNKQDIKEKIFYRLAAINIMEDKLSSYGKSVSSQDIDKQVSLLFQQTGGRDQANKIVNNLYGLNLPQFQDKVLKPMLLREDLQQAIINDDTLAINKSAKAQAEEVMKLVQAPKADFPAIARQYTDDEASVNTGGDLGWVVKGQLDPRWESLIFTASSSTIIPQLVKSNYGYHIVRVEQKLIDPNTNTESVKLRHILIKVDIDKYVKELLDGAKLVKYVK